MIRENYVSFETAKLLKEKGFREWCNWCYSPSRYYNGNIIDGDEESELKASGEWDESKATWIHSLYPYNCDNEQSEGIYAAPTLSIAMKWLREKHKIIISIIPEPELTYIADIYQDWTLITSLRDFKCSYAEVCETAIKYCLENLT